VSLCQPEFGNDFGNNIVDGQGRIDYNEAIGFRRGEVIKGGSYLRVELNSFVPDAVSIALSQQTFIGLKAQQDDNVRPNASKRNVIERPNLIEGQTTPTCLIGQ
jgi:hypothetical protein